MSIRTYRDILALFVLLFWNFLVHRNKFTYTKKVISNTPLGLSNWVRGLLLYYGSSLNPLARLCFSCLAQQKKSLLIIMQIKITVEGIKRY